jgi:hypothetical protein
MRGLKKPSQSGISIPNRGGFFYHITLITLKNVHYNNPIDYRKNILKFLMQYKRS